MEISDLHVVGVTSMFVASKFEDIYPLKMKTVFEKIAHKKLEIEKIKTLELEIMKSINYKIHAPTVLDFLKVYSIRQKRERLITQIIREKNESILAISALQTWRRRLHERMEKHELYGQVMQDRDIRIKDLVFWTLKLNVEQSKEQKVIEVAARSEKMGRTNSRINQGFSSQGVADILQVDDS